MIRRRIIDEDARSHAQDIVTAMAKRKQRAAARDEFEDNESEVKFERVIKLTAIKIEKMSKIADRICATAEGVHEAIGDCPAVSIKSNEDWVNIISTVVSYGPGENKMKIKCELSTGEFIEFMWDNSEYPEMWYREDGDIYRSFEYDRKIDTIKQFINEAVPTPWGLDEESVLSFNALLDEMIKSAKGLEEKAEIEYEKVLNDYEQKEVRGRK